MAETAPAAAPDVAAAPSPAKAAPAKKPKKAAGGAKARKPAGPSVTELITKAVSASKERKGLSLAALKKALAAGGYDVEKSNSRIKLGLKSLVSKVGDAFFTSLVFYKDSSETPMQDLPRHYRVCFTVTQD
ncbi:UNVERIFIED_CONTAM: hypothetical protein H355_006481 [Colinus virginianus]|nr:hypothetical protein H355_006481 [Colinus virginianus]